MTIQLGLMVIWSRRRSRLWARVAWAGFAAIPTLTLLSHFVVTSREQIIRLCHNLAGSVEAGDIAAIRRRLAYDFKTDSYDLVEFIDHLTETLTHFHVEDSRLYGFDVTFPNPDVGVAEFHASARVRSPDLLYESLASHWRLTFRRTGGTWLLKLMEYRQLSRIFRGGPEGP